MSPCESGKIAIMPSKISEILIKWEISPYLEKGTLGYLPVGAARGLPLGQGPAEQAGLSLQLLLRQYLHRLNLRD